MTTAITKLQTGIELSEIELMILEEAEAEENAFDMIPTRINIAPGGINQFAASDGETMKEISAIVAVSQKARAYWPGKGSDQAPLCTSPDGVHGNFAVAPPKEQMNEAVQHRTVHPAIRLYDEQREFPDHFDCASCPLSQWDSADVGRGQACKAMRRLVIFVDGWVAPALLTLPPTSIKVWDVYASALKNKRLAYFAVRSKLTLEKAKSAGGDPYSVLSVQSAGSLTPDELRAVIELRKQYSEYVRELPIEIDDYPMNGDSRTIDTETGEIIDDGEVTPF